MSASWTDTLATLRTWQRQRLPHGLFVPAAGALALASSVGQDSSVVPRLLVAWGAVALLRLWDDLEDRETDRRLHPERVRLGDHAGRLGLLVAAGLVAIASWAPLILALAAALFLFYRLRAAPLEAVLLVKYPLLVGCLRGSVDAEGLAAMGLVYGGLLLDGDHPRWGAVACWLATLALCGMAPLPASLVLAFGLALPWVKPVLGRPGVLAGVVVQLLAFHLATR